MTWALFDLDDTLLDHDSFARFLIHILRRNPIRLILALAVLPFVSVLLARRRWKLRGASLLLWVGTVGVRQTALDDIVRRYVNGLRARDRLRPAGSDALELHFENGDQVVVVTACAELLAVPLCQDIDSRIEVVGSALRRQYGGFISGRHCHGGRKVEMLAERGVVDGVIAAYGDSQSDAPMLNLARTAFLINMAAPVASRVRAQLSRPDKVVVADWPIRESDTGKVNRSGTADGAGGSRFSTPADE
ncbi:MAG: haloacid dehalogenase-like hydrolase [Nakamurella sp.]